MLTGDDSEEVISKINRLGDNVRLLFADLTNFGRDLAQATTSVEFICRVIPRHKMTVDIWSTQYRDIVYVAISCKGRKG